MTNTSFSKFPPDVYEQYLVRLCPNINLSSLSSLAKDVQKTDFNEPESAIDLNNFAVIALIEAESSSDASLRGMNLELALEALKQGVELQDHPLCAAHLALVHSMIGEGQIATQMAFSTLLQILQPAFNSPQKAPLGLIYLPSYTAKKLTETSEELQQAIEAKDGYAQALVLLTEVLCQSQLVFYNQFGLRFLSLANQVNSQSASINLKLGLSSLCNQQWEGLLYLQQARKLAPKAAPILQALYLAYKDLQQPKVAQEWYNIAHEYHQQDSQSLDWRWANLNCDSLFSYVPFEDDLLLAVESTLNSIVTKVLLAEGDWFELEMEFWRNVIQPGMTVIDVGANAGVYTFSAAKRVGKEGRVLAVEPFSGCVQCLKETCQVNDLTWVKICAGAASDRNGTARLALHGASELNEVISDDSTLVSGDFQDINCFTLDSLIEQEKLNRLDWLKLDAEGHEMQVLMGSERLLRQFAPKILYENIAGSKESNTPVAEFLLSKGYQLFRYQPYLRQLLPVTSIEELQGNLNIIALFQNSSDDS